jgi:hypothetical protein
MNDDNQDPLDQKLDHLYRQHKQLCRQQNPMPAHINNSIHQAAKKKDKSRRFITPMWGSTTAACFVAIMWVNFTPQKLQDQRFDEASAPVSQLSSPQTVEYIQPEQAQIKRRAHSVDSVVAPTPTTNMVPEEAESMQVKQKLREEVLTYQTAPVPANFELKTSQLTAPGQKPQQLTRVNQARKQASGALQTQMLDVEYSQVNNKVSVTKSHPSISQATVMIGKLQEQSVNTAIDSLNETMLKDCNGVSFFILLEEQWRTNNTVNDWIKITHNPEGNIIKVEKLLDNTQCEHVDQ